MTATVIPFTSCPVCYGYRLKLHRVAGDLLEVVRTEYAAHLAASDNPRHPRPPETVEAADARNGPTPGNFPKPLDNR